MIFVDTLWTQNQSSTQHFSNEYHQNACRRVSVDDNVHEQSTEIEDETTVPLEETPNAEQTASSTAPVASTAAPAASTATRPLTVNTPPSSTDYWPDPRPETPKTSSRIDYSAMAPGTSQRPPKRPLKKVITVGVVHKEQVLGPGPCPCSSCTATNVHTTQDIYNIYDNRIEPKVQPYVLAPISSRGTNFDQDTTDNDSDVASRPGRTLVKDVDENPTENPSQVPLEETPNAEQTVNIISSDDDDFKLSKKTSRRKRAKKADDDEFIPSSDDQDNFNFSDDDDFIPPKKTSRRKRAKKADDDDEFIPSKKTTKPKKAKQEKTTKPRRSKTSFYQKGQIVWYIAVRSKKMSEKGNLVWDGVPRSVVNIFDDNFKLKDNEVLLANLGVATSETTKPAAFKKFVTPIKEVGNPSRKSAQTGHECLITFSEEDEENQRIFNILCQKLSEDEVEKIRKQMEIVRKVEIEDIWDEEEKFLYLTGAKEFISDVNKNNPEPESEPRPEPERIKTRSSGRLSKNDIIIEPVETSNEPKIVNEEVVKYFETNQRLKKYLLDILKGKHPDLVRHRLSMDVNARFGGQSNIQHLSNVLFLQEEEDGATDAALFHITHNLVLDAKEDVAHHDSYQYDWNEYFKETYAKYVLIPEGIIYYLKNKLKMKDEAEEYFMQHQAPKLKYSDPDDDEPVLPPVQESRRPYHWDLYQNNPYDNVDHIPDID